MKEESDKMTIRAKKLLVTLLMSAMFTTSVFASTTGTFNLVDVVRGDFLSGGLAQKGNDYSFGTITVTNGPIYSRATVYAKIQSIGKLYCYTTLGVFTSPNTTARPSYVGDSMSSNYKEYNFEVAAMLDRSAYVAITTVKGSFTP